MPEPQTFDELAKWRTDTLELGFAADRLYLSREAFLTLAANVGERFGGSFELPDQPDYRLMVLGVTVICRAR